MILHRRLEWKYGENWFTSAAVFDTQLEFFL